MSSSRITYHCLFHRWLTIGLRFWNISVENHKTSFTWPWIQLLLSTQGLILSWRIELDFDPDVSMWPTAFIVANVFFFVFTFLVIIHHASSKRPKVPKTIRNRHLKCKIQTKARQNHTSNHFPSIKIGLRWWKLLSDVLFPTETSRLWLIIHGPVLLIH